MSNLDVCDAEQTPSAASANLVGRFDGTGGRDWPQSVIVEGGAWVRAGMGATLYSGQDLSGRSFALGADGAGNLDRPINDRGSSLRVDRGYSIFCSEADLPGECRTFGPGEYPGLPPELDNRISSGAGSRSTIPTPTSPAGASSGNPR